MVDDSGPPWPDPVSTPRTFTADTETARRMTWAAWRLTHRHSTTWWLYATAIGSPSLLWAIGVIDVRWAVLVGAVLVSLFVLGDLPRLRRQLRKLAPPGTEFAVGFSSTAMSLRTPQSVGQYDFSAFKSLELSGNYVFLRGALGGTYFVLPRTLFTDEDIARFRAGLGS
ncbi:YcxB family protein [Nocardioides koreensis]